MKKRVKIQERLNNAQHRLIFIKGKEVKRRFIYL